MDFIDTHTFQFLIFIYIMVVCLWRGVLNRSTIKWVLPCSFISTILTLAIFYLINEIMQGLKIWKIILDAVVHAEFLIVEIFSTFFTYVFLAKFRKNLFSNKLNIFLFSTMCSFFSSLFFIVLIIIAFSFDH